MYMTHGSKGPLVAAEATHLCIFKEENHWCDITLFALPPPLHNFGGYSLLYCRSWWLRISFQLLRWVC